MINVTVSELLSLISKSENIKIYDWSMPLPVMFSGKPKDTPPYLKDRHVIRITAVSGSWPDSYLCVWIAKEL